ncbi:hypothetical protein O7635_05395 [Asanoa sp. WMMD1127]|uniref:hypothetical protein n=1 Tax=Asanoa sp. WMMD1127 TaxID=3016107 RepID=UPI00241794DB|nr:hypothetical protein [Asanoa sp. WMMD1127]MDG4821287.1 hypothetical protein [Asanoa sp. WMMD1127]
MKIPFAEAPAKEKPTNWWKTVPGQGAIVVIAGGAFLILMAVVGVIGPHAR